MRVQVVGAARIAYGERFRRMWRFYLLSCAGAFHPCSLQVFSILFSKESIFIGNFVRAQGTSESKFSEFKRGPILNLIALGEIRAKLFLTDHGDLAHTDSADRPELC